jgi:hypothetical protein
MIDAQQAMRIAHLLGRAPKAAKTARGPDKPKPKPSGAVTAGQRHLASRGKDATFRPLVTSAAPRTPKPTPTPTKKAAPEAAKRKAAAAPGLSSFGHLLQGNYDFEAPDYTGNVPVTAAQVMAAVAKAKTPLGTGAPPPTGIAAQVLAAAQRARTGGNPLSKPTGVAAAVLAAAEKARTPAGFEPLPPDSIAARVIAAGKKRRGEI